MVIRLLADLRVPHTKLWSTALQVKPFERNVHETGGAKKKENQKKVPNVAENILKSKNFKSPRSSNYGLASFT